MEIPINYYKLTLLLLLLFSIFSSTKISFAQDVPYTTTNTTTYTAPSETTQNYRFNLLWVLPLIALPVLLYIIWSIKQNTNHMDLSTSYSGIKGGRAEKESEAETLKHNDK